MDFFTAYNNGDMEKIKKLLNDKDFINNKLNNKG